MIFHGGSANDAGKFEGVAWSAGSAWWGGGIGWPATVGKSWGLLALAGLASPLQHTCALQRVSWVLVRGGGASAARPMVPCCASPSQPSTPTSRICCRGGSLPCPPSLPCSCPTSPKTTSSQLMRWPAADAVFLPPQELWGTCIWCRDNVSLAYLTWHATVWQECNLWATLLRHLRSPLTTNDMLRALLTLTLDHL